LRVARGTPCCFLRCGSFVLAIVFAPIWLALTFLIHVIIWRLRRPTQQTSAVLGFFLASIPLGLLAAFLGGFARDFADTMLITQFLLAAALAYTCINSAIQEDSIAVMVATFVAMAGPEGCTADEVRSVLDVDRTLAARLCDFEKAGMIERRDGRYLLTGRGRSFRNGFELIRRLLRLPRGG
jgi:hypothetical protein